MYEIFQSVFLGVALVGLALALVVLVARSRTLRIVQARQQALWSTLTPCGRAISVSVLTVCILYGGGKQGVEKCLNVQVSECLNVRMLECLNEGKVLLYAQKKAQNWNIRGAWKDSFWLNFADGWRFPYGTNHLYGGEVISYGELWQTPFDNDPIASLGAQAEIVPNLSSFFYEFMPSNSYRFVWENAAINRDTNNLLTASLELFRNGDIAVTTNGVAKYLPRELPIDHEGFGQDDEWVEANFTNSTEILSRGYAAWVDAQVGEGLTNGLYKLTVTVPETPLETVGLSVGDYSVAITNAGDYVFLLEKCVDYSLSVYPRDATNFLYSVVDDVPSSRERTMAGVAQRGRWSSDSAKLKLIVPYYPLVPLAPPAHIIFPAKLYISPPTWQPSQLHDTEIFAAVVTDIPWYMRPAYKWNTSDSNVVSIKSPSSRVTEMTCHQGYDAFQHISLSLEVAVGDSVLRAYYGFDGDDDQQVASLTVSAPEVLFINDDDDNDDGTSDWMESAFALDDDIVTEQILFHSPYPTNGTIVIEDVFGHDGGIADKALIYSDPGCTQEIEPGASFPVAAATRWSMPLYFNPVATSSSVPGVQLKVRWIPEQGYDLTASSFSTVVMPVLEPICNEVKGVTENAVVHTYTVNPSGVGVGRDAYFRLRVYPQAYSNDKIVWSAEGDGEVSFPDGNTGREVRVRGLSAGDVELTVTIGDRTHCPPTFPLKVVENVTVDLRAWIIEDDKGNTAQTIENVREMVRKANDIYAQVGVTLNLVEPVVVTNIPNAYDAVYYESFTNQSSLWTFWNIVDLQSSTRGLECYFINTFSDSSDTLAANSSKGMIITREADYMDFAHEIGHAFGMRDIYVKSDNTASSAVELSQKVLVKGSYSYSDWNGGTGMRYYPYGTKQRDLISRLLMNGVRSQSSVPRDISAGDIYGVHKVYGEAGAIWELGMTPVGFPWHNRNPMHN